MQWIIIGPETKIEKRVESVDCRVSRNRITMEASAKGPLEATGGKRGQGGKGGVDDSQLRLVATSCDQGLVGDDAGQNRRERTEIEGQ